MRLAYFSHSALPSQQANSVHVMAMAEAIAALGHDVTLYAWESRSAGLPDLYRHYGVKPIFRIAQYLTIPFPGTSLLAAIAAAAAARKQGASLVFGRNLRACAAAALLGIPVIYETHQPVGNHTSFDGFLFRALLRSRLLQAVVVISDALAAIVESETANSRPRILVAHDGASIPQKAPEVRGLCRSGRVQIGYVGHLYEGRGIGLIAELARRLPEVDFNLIGGTEADVDRWTKRCRHQTNMVFHGFRPPSETAAYREACDILIAPYERKTMVPAGIDTASWMSPLKVFEYMAARRPIICSDLPVLREVLTEDCAILVSPEDVEGWEKAIRQLAASAERRKELADQAYRKFEAQYTWGARAERILREALPA